MGVTLVPRLAVPAAALPAGADDGATDAAHRPLVRYLPVHGDHRGAPPTRRVVLVWRRSFTRYEAIAALRNAIYACELPGVQRLMPA